MLEGLTIASPAGYIHIRQNDHQGLKDVVLGYSKNCARVPLSGLGSRPDRHVSHYERHGAAGLAEAG